MPDFDTIAIIGAGAWGAALASAAVRAGRHVTLIARNPAHADIARGPTDIIAVASAKDVLRAARIVMLAVPAQASRDALTSVAQMIAPATPVIACAKGIERGTRCFMTQVIGHAAPHARPAILSGPGFAGDVARGLPTATTLAAHDDMLAASLCEALGSATFRPYRTTDVRGVEIGGAAKNVLAIAAGIVAGKKLGASALAALITRGYAELARFGRACGARAETLGGLSGLGDLVLTCSSPQSRNFAFGAALGEGQDPQAAGGGRLAEGAFTASVLRELARDRGVDMPICEAVNAIIEGRAGIDEAIDGLLNRPFKAEM